MDQSVPGVVHMVGGCRGGYARWRNFLLRGLDQYAARRNNAMTRDGVSRLSAHHRFGMVSPFAIARAAAARRSPGAEKFLDEFLTWRELAYATCAQKGALMETLQVGF